MMASSLEDTSLDTTLTESSLDTNLDPNFSSKNIYFVLFKGYVR